MVVFVSLYSKPKYALNKKNGLLYLFITFLLKENKYHVLTEENYFKGIQNLKFPKIRVKLS